MSMSVTMLAIGFVLVAALLLSLNFYSRWNVWLKVGVTLVVGAFYIINYEAINGLLGWPTTAATPALADNRPAANAPALQRLVDAGAQILAKANMHELAFGITSNNAHTGAVCNPHDPCLWSFHRGCCRQRPLLPRSQP